MSVSCAAAGECTAVGGYDDSAGHGQALVVETDGVWSGGIEASLPDDAGAGGFLSSVSCVDPGDCTSIGSYVDSSGNSQGLLLTESSGTWAQGVRAQLPDDAASNPDAGGESVSCPSAGNCAALVIYTGSGGYRHAALLTETDAVWSPAVELGGSTYTVGVGQVACRSAGNCTAVANDGSLFDETSGVWEAGVTLPLPANAAADPDSHAVSVSCPTANSCTVLGTYIDSSGHQRGLLVDQSSGLWGQAVELPMPGDADGNRGGALNAISCAAVDACGAVGYYVDAQHQVFGLLVDSTPSPGPQPSGPVVVTGAPKRIEARSAILGGTVNPEGSRLTDCELQWGADTTYEGVAMPCDGAVGSGTSPVPVVGALSGLTPNTTYHYRFVAESAFGRVYGDDRSFTTAHSPKPARARTLLSTAPPARYAATSSKIRLPEGHVAWLKIHAYSLTGAPIRAQMLTLRDGSHVELGRTNKGGVVIFRVARGRDRTVIVRFAGSKRFAPAERKLRLRYHA